MCDYIPELFNGCWLFTVLSQGQYQLSVVIIVVITVYYVPRINHILTINEPRIDHQLPIN